MTNQPAPVGEQDVAAIAAGLTVAILDIPSRRGSATERFWRCVTPSSDEQCWIWKGGKSSRGYGRLSTRLGSSTPAHRVSYVLHHGEIPVGFVVDHICRVRLCVNPAHLRAVTPKTNTLENSVAVTALNAKKTHCPKGHPLSGENLIIRRGFRICKSCHHRVQREWYYRSRDKALLERNSA